MEGPASGVPVAGDRPWPGSGSGQVAGGAFTRPCNGSNGGVGFAMLSGFNTNFRYRGVLFHVQTEDSGLENPHVITHLFHGGNIMASEKRDYSEFVGAKDGDDLEEAIRKLMESLHKSMLKQLSRGEHDMAIEARMGAGVFRAATPLVELETPSITEEELPLAIVEDAPTVNTSPPAAEDGSADSGMSRIFGDRVVSEKSLDEVVLDYLVENARKRKRTTK